MCQELIDGKERFYKTGFFKRIQMGIVSYFSGLFFQRISLDYKVSAACKNCGLCVKNCPAMNIISENGKIKFKQNCSGCLRCLYNCPKQAIQFRTYGFIPVPGGYNITNILKESESAGVLEEKRPQFYDAYVTDENF
ncbi:hypothetical protein EG832_10925 [bacterium]|nr:hypothetical protein [bacterium]